VVVHVTSNNTDHALYKCILSTVISASFNVYSKTHTFVFAIGRISLTRIVYAVCTTRNFAGACWLLRDCSDQCGQIAPYIIIIIIIIIICSVQGKMHVGSTFENDTKELDPRKVYKYLGIEESFDIQHKN